MEGDEHWIEIAKLIAQFHVNSGHTWIVLPERLLKSPPACLTIIIIAYKLRLASRFETILDFLLGKEKFSVQHQNANESEEQKTARTKTNFRDEKGDRKESDDQIEIKSDLLGESLNSSAKESTDEIDIQKIYRTLNPRGKYPAESAKELWKTIELAFKQWKEIGENSWVVFIRWFQEYFDGLFEIAKSNKGIVCEGHIISFGNSLSFKRCRYNTRIEEIDLPFIKGSIYSKILSMPENQINSQVVLVYRALIKNAVLERKKEEKEMVAARRRETSKRYNLRIPDLLEEFHTFLLSKMKSSVKKTMPIRIYEILGGQDMPPEERIEFNRVISSGWDMYQFKSLKD